MDMIMESWKLMIIMLLFYQKYRFYHDNHMMIMTVYHHDRS